MKGKQETDPDKGRGKRTEKQELFEGSRITIDCEKGMEQEMLMMSTEPSV